jgi:hypothetical protein
LYESRRKQKLTAREVMVVSPATPEYLRWSEVPITFDHSDHPDFVPKPGRYPLIVCPIIKDVKLNRVLIDGGSSLNILFLKTFDQMGFSRSLLHTSRTPFRNIVHGSVVIPVIQIFLYKDNTVRGRGFPDRVQFFLGMADTLQVHGDPTLRLLGFEDAKTTWHHLH